MQLSRAFIALSIGLCAATMVAAQTVQPDSLTDPKLPSSSGDDKKLDLPNDDKSTKKSKKTKSTDTTSLSDDKTTDTGTPEISPSPDFTNTGTSDERSSGKHKSKKGKDDNSKVEVTKPGKGIGAGADPSTAPGEDSGKLKVAPINSIMDGYVDVTVPGDDASNGKFAADWAIGCNEITGKYRTQNNYKELDSKTNKKAAVLCIARTGPTKGEEEIFWDYTKLLVQKLNLSNGTDTTATLDTGAAIDKGTKSGATNPSINYGSKDSKDGPTDQPIDLLASTPDSTTDAGSLTSTDVKPTDTETGAGTAGSETTTSPQKRSGFVRRSLAKKLRH
ncbi:hypothetical protein CBOM_03553 [Ceraceosorus bombacis]|uniref:Uncharacterized protein n=1 Tax=Ceraceosorus bombacis TaxID=401625 RepID=A0A0P1BGW3_9BASI|nr:hypothetical protein CBOM_03553 [Ceraceosorus bombacis]